VTSQPRVSVCVQAYNHKQFIHACLDGIINQKVSFDYEILLGEDDSSDGTREICIEYARKYPELIKLFLHDRANNIEVDGAPTGRFNFLYNTTQATGKYLAYCDGDDAWIDPNKLQKQFDFMQANPQCVMVHTNFMVRTSTGKTKKYRRGKLPAYWPTQEKLLLNNYIGTMTAFIKMEDLKKVLEASPEQIFQWPMLDYLIWIKLSETGLIGFLNDITSIYNKRGGSLSAFDDESKHIRFLDAVKDMQLTIIAESKTADLQKDLIVKVHQVYSRKRFRLAVEMKNRADAIDYYMKMKISTRLNPLNIFKFIKVVV